MKYLLIFILLWIPAQVIADPAGDCSGTPSSAVTSLPSPLDKWAQLACTPYGHIITNKDGWVWTYPGGYNPVIIPSQMVRTNPEQLANESYFTMIEMREIQGNEATAAIELFESGFDQSQTKPKVYSLQVKSVSGKSLDFKFFDYGDSKWGMWCNKKCAPQSSFMLLDMSE